MGALIVVVSFLSRSGHQPAGSQVEVSTCTLRKHLVVFVEGTEGVASRKCHELSFKAANRVATSVHEASTVPREVLLQDLGVGTNGSHRDLIRACGRDLLLCCQMLLEVLAILRAPWLRPALIWWRGR